MIGILEDLTPQKNENETFDKIGSENLKENKFDQTIIESKHDIFWIIKELSNEAHLKLVYNLQKYRYFLHYYYRLVLFCIFIFIFSYRLLRVSKYIIIKFTITTFKMFMFIFSKTKIFVESNEFKFSSRQKKLICNNTWRLRF